ncbi:hypothetical protein V7787_52905, partial [Pseudomonas sp. CGJS7]
VSAQGANGSKVAPGETVDLKNTDGNVVVSKIATDDNVSFDLARDLKVDSITAGNSRLDTNGLAIVGGPSVTGNGIDAAGKPISNVGPGVASTDAANVGQVKALADTGLTFTGNDTAAGNVQRKLGETLAIRGAATTAGNYSGANLKTVTDPTTGAIQLQIAESPKFGNVVINDGGSGRISGVADGIG